MTKKRIGLLLTIVLAFVIVGISLGLLGLNITFQVFLALLIYRAFCEMLTIKIKDWF